MEGAPLVLRHYCSSSSSSSSKILLGLSHHLSVTLQPHQQASSNFLSSNYKNTSSTSSFWHFRNFKPLTKRRNKRRLFISGTGAEPVTVKESDTDPSLLASAKDDNTFTLPRLDKTGRFCSPRAARELALLTIYASCLDGHDPVRLFEKRLNAPREPGYIFDKSSLLQYDHMKFGGPPVTTSTVEEAELLLSQFDSETAIEAEVLSAPLKLVYGKLLLRFTRKLLCAVADKWDVHVHMIDKVAPPNWKAEPAGRILEFSILHLAMSEISVLGTRHPIVINEAVDLAKRFCDGSAPRTINGCLRTFVCLKTNGSIST